MLGGRKVRVGNKEKPKPEPTEEDIFAMTGRNPLPKRAARGRSK